MFNTLHLNGRSLFEFHPQILNRHPHCLTFDFKSRFQEAHVCLKLK